MSETKGYLTLTGLAPAGDLECEFKVSRKQVEHFGSGGPEHKFYELYSVAETVKSPLIIAEGLKREEFEQALCYVARPKKRGKGWEAPGPPNMVFLVYMTHDLKIFEWRWEKEDAGKPGHPENATQRFTKIKWTRSLII